MKRCGHFDGKELIPLEEMVGKVRAAVDTRRQDLVVHAPMHVPSKALRRPLRGPVVTSKRAQTSHSSRLRKASQTSGRSRVA